MCVNWCVMMCEARRLCVCVSVCLSSVCHQLSVIISLCAAHVSLIMCVSCCVSVSHMCLSSCCVSVSHHICLSSTSSASHHVTACVSTRAKVRRSKGRERGQREERERSSMFACRRGRRAVAHKVPHLSLHDTLFFLVHSPNSCEFGVEDIV